MYGGPKLMYDGLILIYNGLISISGALELIYGGKVFIYGAPRCPESILKVVVISREPFGCHHKAIDIRLKPSYIQLLSVYIDLKPSCRTLKANESCHKPSEFIREPFYKTHKPSARFFEKGKTCATLPGHTL